jgi:hypothetical protein
MKFRPAAAARGILVFLAGVALVAGIWAVHRGRWGVSAFEPLAHVRSQFEFTLQAPVSVAAPAFGPEAERGWGGHDWNPHFLFPEPAQDIEGAVFTVPHGPHESLWVATVLDFAAGHVQYVSMIDGMMLTRIDIRLRPLGTRETGVTVAYERTALRAEANEHVRQLGEQDSHSGKHWESILNDYLKAQAGPKS